MPNPYIDPPDCCSKIEKKMKAVSKAILTDGCYMINSFMLGTLFHRVPLEILGRIAPRLALQEVVEVAYRVCHE
jgi:hypothetical protein